MTRPELQQIPDTPAPQLEDLLARQKQAFLAQPAPTRQQRLLRLNLLHNALLTHRGALAEAVNQDFSGRSAAETELAEILPLLEGIAYYRKRLKRLMKPKRRHTPLSLMPAKVEVHYQPLGVVGIVVPWNFPIFLALSPLVGALAAGNRAMLKASEFAPATGQLLQRILSDIFAEDDVCMVCGDVDVGRAFTRLPFDHLVFTGSTPVGRIVMKAAAENLTPVTLELGGKSPAVIHPDFPVDEAARRIAFGKSINAGQVCVSPDYVLCQDKQIPTFIAAFRHAFEHAYPTLADNNDYSAIISARQKQRLEDCLQDARDKGATLITLGPNESLDASQKLPMTLVLGATTDMRVMQEEIFGPILPILGYQDIETALQQVRLRPRPLALYYFDWNAQRADQILRSTHSGGVCINDTMSHVMADDIPFGGIGDSGTGHYHGEEGFRTFSKAKGVVRKGRINLTALIAPPWSNRMFRLFLAWQSLRFRRIRL